MREIVYSGAMDETAEVGARVTSNVDLPQTFENQQKTDELSHPLKLEGQIPQVPQTRPAAHTGLGLSTMAPPEVMDQTPQAIPQSESVNLSNAPTMTRRELLQAVGVAGTGAVATGAIAAHIGLFDRIMGIFGKKQSTQNSIPETPPISQASPNDFEQRASEVSNVNPGLSRSISEQQRSAAYTSPDNPDQ